ncbi:MAG: hypothetical protein Q4A98_08560 [Comamonadaceae bacterium]|nr:hypothetical protein [Comamonadaceae bacterium]
MTSTVPKTTPEARRACPPSDHLAGIERALQRAYENACRIAWQTGTAMVFEKDGQIVKVHFPQPTPPTFTP